jgi:hypothetical protein
VVARHVVKLSPTGKPPVRYSGTSLPAPEGWVAVRAPWIHGTYELGYLTFQNGDTLDEFFALERPYNAFALYRADGEFAGWYCNVTHLTRIVDDEIHWHDLFIDVIVYPDGRTLVLDEDELAEAGVEASDPTLYAMILAARDELLELAARRAFPFSTAPERSS